MAIQVITAKSCFAAQANACQWECFVYLLMCIISECAVNFENFDVNRYGHAKGGLGTSAWCWHLKHHDVSGKCCRSS